MNDVDMTKAYNYFLAAHFSSSQLRIFDYNRVVRDLGGRSPDDFLEAIRGQGFAVEENHRARRPGKRGAFGLYLGERGWFRLTAGADTTSEDDPIRRLDVAVLAERILEPLLGITDPRTDERLDFVGGIRGMEELERRVSHAGWAAAFALYPTSLDDLMRVADSSVMLGPLVTKSLRSIITPSSSRNARISPSAFSAEPTMSPSLLIPLATTVVPPSPLVMKNRAGPRSYADVPSVNASVI